MAEKENPLENFAERWPMPESMHKPEFHDWVKSLAPEDQRAVAENINLSMRAGLDGMSMEQIIGKEPQTSASDPYQNSFPSTDIPDIFKSAFEKED